MPHLPEKAFHFIDHANWTAIRRDGLLSTNRILEQADFPAEVEARVRAYRPEGITLPDGRYIRDQSPMPPKALAPCLEDGLQPQDWYDLVNRHVFFWLDPDRVARHRRALANRAQMLLTLDARALADAYRPLAAVTPFNIGSARRKPAPRGHRTLVPLADWLDRGWTAEAAPGRSPRSRSHGPAELVIAGAVPDALTFVTAVEPIEPVR